MSLGCLPSTCRRILFPQSLKIRPGSQNERKSTNGSLRVRSKCQQNIGLITDIIVSMIPSCSRVIVTRREITIQLIVLGKFLIMS
jgi:hypothetical protein